MFGQLKMVDRIGVLRKPSPQTGVGVSMGIDYNEKASGSEGLDQHRSRGLSDTQKMLIEHRISNEKPSTGAAYILCLFLGWLGAHRFYLGRPGSAIAMLLTLGGFGLWVLIDLFLIPGIIRDNVDGMRQRMTIEAMAA